MTRERERDSHVETVVESELWERLLLCSLVSRVFDGIWDLEVVNQEKEWKGETRKVDI
jgi:hypothetical protein